ncbi:unnamed protein product [Didymodactylos carnosus]|uniref:Sodium/hydrogen exchanger 8 n=1 Tax=Didymodactylos carnosus TaxID=1234261 RepID=A0A813QKV5_9BILA|nr:unnamed protein product [Didymodactylos carnosus]CAF0768600.1 unnamed protein product [Didymodactylos carnosus]CAF3503572.1 unnamed protein product [Didymodactylos carnosus]CAF3550420.1 unnamed protein product [Didymodactylos carnosus]
MSDLSSSSQIFLLLILLFICVLVIHLLIRKRFNYLPESVAVIYIGAIFGFLLKLSNQWLSPTATPSASTSQLLNSNLFFMLFLPPIIFEQGYHLHKGNFFQNLGTITTFAIFGTTINALTTGAGLWLLGTWKLSYKLPWRECFIIGSLNSAIDPVAILSIFQVLNVDQLLYMLVFGESILNDAVAIVLTNVIVESKTQIKNLSFNSTTLKTMAVIGLLATPQTITTSTTNKLLSSDLVYSQNVVGKSPKLVLPFEQNEQNRLPWKNPEDENENESEGDEQRDGNEYDEPETRNKKSLIGILPPSSSSITSTQLLTTIKSLFQISTKFSLMFYLSSFIGLIFGLISALITKYINFDKSAISLEISFMFIISYSSYMLAELLHLSGIMSILVCGLTMSHYTHQNLSQNGKKSIQTLFRTIAFLAETCVFAYLGLGIFEYKHEFHLNLIIWTIILTLVGRAAHVFPLSFILNCFRTKQQRITLPMQLIMWFSGLRGAISYALSVHVGKYYGEDEEELKRILVTTTLITVLFTILVLGGLTMPVVKCMKKYAPQNHQQQINNSHRDNDNDTSERTLMSKTRLYDDILNNDENYLKQRRKHVGMDNDEDDEYEIQFMKPNQLKGMEKLNEYYIKPLLVRKISLNNETRSSIAFDNNSNNHDDRKPLLEQETINENNFSGNNNNNNRKKKQQTKLIKKSKSNILLKNDQFDSIPISDDDDDDAEDDILVVPNLQHECYQLRTITDTTLSRQNRTSLSTLPPDEDDS